MLKANITYSQKSRTNTGFFFHKKNPLSIYGLFVPNERSLRNYRARFTKFFFSIVRILWICVGVAHFLALDRSVKAGKCICKAGYWEFTKLAIKGRELGGAREERTIFVWTILRLQS